MPTLTLNQAAKEAGRSKATILDAIRGGKLSAPKDEQGRYQIDPAELFRVYPPTGQQHTETGTDHAEPTTETTLLRQKVELLERIIEGIGNERDDLRRRLDTEGEERRKAQAQLTALLTDQRAKPEPEPKPKPQPAPTPEPPPQPQQAAANQKQPRRSLWATLKKWA